LSSPNPSNLFLPEALLKSIQELKASTRTQRSLTNDLKSQALQNLAKALETAESEILAANNKDLAALAASATMAFRDRLTLNRERLEGIATSLRAVAALPDPNNEVTEERVLENGLKIRRVRAPLGCLFMIFESRPNVILEAFSLAFKSGNVILLRGGSDSASTAAIIYKIMNESLQRSGIHHRPFLGMQDYDRALVENLLTRKDLIDVVVPRGGDRLIEFVQAKAQMPIIKNDRGLCHTYVDASADLEMAVKIVANAKIQRPGVCNSLETVLVHSSVAKEFLPKLYKATEGLRWKTDPASTQILKSQKNIEAATEEDWDTEHLDLIMNCRVVESLEEAISHIEKHGSKHSEAIVTSSEANARKFQSEIDAAAVYWNASTRFTDGFALGLGGELGISTQKLHVRGPVGLRELTTPRWVIDGEGQIR
jgi:glutamate-5-semialdehyde dehydrogenase